MATYDNNTKDAYGKSINDYKTIYSEAAARGDQAAMDAANAAANAIRTSNGGTADVATYKVDKNNTYSVSQQQAMGYDTGNAGKSSTDVNLLGALAPKNTGTSPLSSLVSQAKQFAIDNQDTLVNGAQRLISEYQQEQQQKQATDLTQYLKDMYAANTEAALSQLKGAYQNGLAGYEAQEAKLPELYDAQRNRQAAQDAIARMNWDERAAANGMNSGTSGQAALSRSAAYRGALADIDAAQANAQSDIDLAKNNLLTQYQNAIQQTEAQNKSALAQALYNELVRQDENTSADTIASLKTALSEAQNATAAATSSAKPALTASQAYTAYKNGIRTDEVMGAMDYYYGIGGNGSDYAIPTSAPTGTKNATTKKAGSVVNNGGLSASDVAKVQEAFNSKFGYSLATDGSWGPDSQNTTGYADAASAMAALGMSGGNDRLTSGEAIYYAALAGSTAGEQVRKLAEFYKDGRITEQQLKDLQYSILNPTK